MCQPKPGPRCSADARKAYDSAIERQKGAERALEEAESEAAKNFKELDEAKRTELEAEVNRRYEERTIAAAGWYETYDGQTWLRESGLEDGANTYAEIRKTKQESLAAYQSVQSGEISRSEASDRTLITTLEAEDNERGAMYVSISTVTRTGTQGIDTYAFDYKNDPENSENLVIGNERFPAKDKKEQLKTLAGRVMEREIDKGAMPQGKHLGYFQAKQIIDLKGELKELNQAQQVRGQVMSRMRDVGRSHTTGYETMQEEALRDIARIVSVGGKLDARRQAYSIQNDMMVAGKTPKEFTEAFKNVEPKEHVTNPEHRLAFEKTKRDLIKESALYKW